MITPQASLEEQLADIFKDELHVEVPSPEADLLGTGMLDSLRLVELLVHLERHFGVRVDLEALELDDFRSLATVAALVANRRQTVG